MPLALRPEQRRRIIQYVAMVLSIIVCAVAGMVPPIPEPPKPPEPYHTSILSGEGWVLELLIGHPERLRTELGMYAEDFKELISVLRTYGHRNARSVSLEEQVAIFLYTCVTGLPTRHVGERFQRSNDTISRYFRKMVTIFSSPPFYTSFVTPPDRTALSSKFKRNPKFWPYFKDSIGALDGSHIPIAPPARVASAFRNRKGFLSQNCLFACDFNLLFTYVLTGWEGSTSDARLFDDARSRHLNIPDGKYLLGDLGFPSRPYVLVPYRGVRYHLAEWGRANVRPTDKRELFNLRHASARNVIERIFGILKRRFRLLLLPLPYPLDVQVRIPAALCAIHNFIRIHNPDEEPLPNDDPDGMVGGDVDYNPESLDDEGTEGDRALRDQIAEHMWQDYMVIRRERGMDTEEVSELDEYSESDM